MLVVDGQLTELGSVIDRIRKRPRKIRSLFLIATPDGQPLTKFMLRYRFDAARLEAIKATEKAGDSELAERIKAFQFRDIRPKAASEIADLGAASDLLGHTEKQITKRVYRRVGELVKPTR
jgi:integrase